MSTRRRDLAAAVAGIVLGGLAGAGVVSAGGGGREVIACVEPGTGAVVKGADCARGTPVTTGGAAPVEAR